MALHDDIRDHKTIINELGRLRKELKEKADVIQDFNWLKQAEQTWMELGLESIQKPGRVILILALGLQGLGLLSILVQLIIGSPFEGWKFTLSILSLVNFLVASGLNWIYLKRIRRWFESASQADEKEAIKAKYQTRFKKIYARSDRS